MIKKTITYKDFTGEEQTDEFYFHLTEADILELEVSANGNSLSAWTEKIVKAQNGAEIISTFKKIIDVSYGIKSDDERRFIKNAELLAEFKSTNAYSKLFMALATNAEESSTFVNGIMPEGFVSAGKTIGQSASEAARKASAERMQGFRKPQPKPESTTERQPDLPVELQTAAPVLEAVAAPNPEPSASPDIDGMSIEELRALALSNRQGGVQ